MYQMGMRCGCSQLSSLQQRLIILAITLRFVMGGIDSSILPLGISNIAMDFGGDYASILFLIDGILFASALIFSGRLGDQVGLKPVFLIGIGLFTLGSFLATIAGSMEWLLFYRLISSLGLTLSLAVSLPIIMTNIPEENRGRSIGYTIMGMSIGAITGPVLCGYILEKVGWKEMYLVLIPIGITILIIGMIAIPCTRCAKSKVTYDFPGLLLIFLTLGVFSIGMNLGFLNQDPVFFAEAIAVSVLSGCLFVWWEKRASVPLVDFHFLLRKAIIYPLIILMIIYCIYRISIYFDPIYLSEILRISPFMAGLIMSFGAIIPAIGSPLSGHYMERNGLIGMKNLLIFSGIFGILSSLCMILTPILGALPAVYLSIFFLGIMFSLGYTAIYGYYYSGVPLEHVGMAGGIIETTGEFSALLAISFVQIFFAAGVFLSTGGTISARDIIVQAVPGVQVLFLFTFLISIGLIAMSMKLSVSQKPESSSDSCSD